MKCKLCHINEVKDNNSTISICDTCKMEIEFAFSYHINGKEVTKEEYERQINEEFKK